MLSGVGGELPAGANHQTPNITAAQVSVAVTYDSSGLFHYVYAVKNPPANTGAVAGISFPLTAAAPQGGSAGLPRTGWCKIRSTVPDPTQVVPVGAISHQNWRPCVGVGGVFSAWVRNDAAAMLPGVELTDAVEVISPAPPGLRPLTITPAWDPAVDYFDPRAIGMPDTIDPLEIHSFTTAPVDPATYGATLQTPYLGGGQSAAEVNPFLRYLAPDARPVVLPSSQNPIIYNVVILYGPTTNPATFSATLNGASVAAQFHPCPGCAEVVPLTLPGAANRNVIKLSIEGVTSSGHTARDTDTLILKVQ